MAYYASAAACLSIGLVIIPCSARVLCPGSVMREHDDVYRDPAANPRLILRRHHQHHWTRGNQACT
eukprot:13529014-Alexandrium_andersonii.AAC.1